MHTDRKCDCLIRYLSTKKQKTGRRKRRRKKRESKQRNSLNDKKIKRTNDTKNIKIGKQNCTYLFARLQENK